MARLAWGSWHYTRGIASNFGDTHYVLVNVALAACPWPGPSGSIQTWCFSRSYLSLSRNVRTWQLQQVPDATVSWAPGSLWAWELAVLPGPSRPLCSVRGSPHPPAEPEGWAAVCVGSKTRAALGGNCREPKAALLLCGCFSLKLNLNTFISMSLWSKESHRIHKTLLFDLPTSALADVSVCTCVVWFCFVLF